MAIADANGAYRRAPGVDTVEIGFRGEARRVPVDAHGWWLVLETAEECEHFDLARVWPRA